MKKISRIMEIDPWHIQSSKLEKEERRLQESLTSIGNGYMGMRGNFEEGFGRLRITSLPLQFAPTTVPTVPLNPPRIPFVIVAIILFFSELVERR